MKDAFGKDGIDTTNAWIRGEYTMTSTQMTRKYATFLVSLITVLQFGSAALAQQFYSSDWNTQRNPRVTFGQNIASEDVALPTASQSLYEGNASNLSCSDLAEFGCDPACGKKRPAFQWGAHLEAGIYANGRGNRNRGDGFRSNGPLGVREVTDFNMNQFWLWAGREAQTQKHGFDWGWRADLIYGTDFNAFAATGGNYFKNATGEKRKWDSSWYHGDYGFALPQLYAEVAINRWKIKGGHFFSPLGYESHNALENDFYSQSYFGFYGAPRTLTGVLFERSLGRGWDIYAGWVNGHDASFDNSYSDSMFVGGFSWAPNRCFKLSYGFLGGKFEDDFLRRSYDTSVFLASDDLDRYLHSLTVEMRLTNQLRAVTEANYSWDDGTLAGVVDTDAKWYGISQYLIYDVSCKWSVGGRFEWFRDKEASELIPITRIGNGSDDYYALTAGVTWKPCSNLMIRPEIRYDWTEHNSAFDPDMDGNYRNKDQFSYGFDLVYKFR